MSGTMKIVRLYSSHGARTYKPLFEENAELIRKAKSMNQHDHGDPGLWKKVTFFFAIPMIGLGFLNSYLRHGEHERPDFVEYDHLKINIKPFPWGDGIRSFFHNPHNNALKGIGYEA